MGKRTFLRSEVFRPNGVGGGPRGCRALGFLDPVDFSLTEGFTWVFPESWEVSGRGNGSGTIFFVVFVESVSGGTSSESEESQSSGSTGVGGLAGNGGCRDEGSGAVRTGVVEGFTFTTPSRPPGGPFFLLRPRPRPGPLFAPMLGSSSRGRLANRGLLSNGSCPRAMASSSLAFLSATRLAVGNLFFRSAIQASISSGVFKVTLVPWMTMGFLEKG